VLAASGSFRATISGNQIRVNQISASDAQVTE